MGSVLLFRTPNQRRGFTQSRGYLVILATIFIGFLTACGVKGDPLPPEKPAQIGTGQPNFSKGISKLPPEEETPSRSEPVEEVDEEEEEE